MIVCPSHSGYAPTAILVPPNWYHMYVPSESIVSVQSPRGPEDPGLSVIDDAVAASTIAIVPHPHAVDAKNNLNFPKVL